MESNSKNEVKWAKELVTTPWNIRAFMISMDFFETQLKSVCFMKIMRFVNDLANFLAKADVKKGRAFFSY